MTTPTKKLGYIALGVACGYTLAASTPLSSADLTIGIGGNGQNKADAADAPTVIGGMLARDAEQGQDIHNLRYHATVWPDGEWTHDESISDGIRNGNTVIDDYRATHPGEQITVKGHSLGAPVALALAPKVDKVIVYGSPSTSMGLYRALPGVYPGTSSPGAQPLPPNAVSVCRKFDWICDTRAPWEDPSYFVQSFAGYAFNGYHYYAPDEGETLPPGEHLIDAPPPIRELPGSTPTGLPAAPSMPLPAWEPGPLPTPLPGPYEALPVSTYVPDYAEPFIPREVLDWTPPPIVIPDLGIRFP